MITCGGGVEGWEEDSCAAWLSVIYLQLPECSRDPSSYFLVQPHMCSGLTPTLMAEWQSLCGYDLELPRTPGHSPPRDPQADDWEGCRSLSLLRFPALLFPGPSSQRKRQMPTERLPPNQCRLQGHSASLHGATRHIGKVHQKACDTPSHFTKSDHATKDEHCLSRHSFQPRKGPM